MTTERTVESPCAVQWVGKSVLILDESNIFNPQTVETFKK